MFPRVERKFSKGGNFIFLPWKFIFPRLETFWKPSQQSHFCYLCGRHSALSR